ncbi:MAG: Putative L-lactate dehydrogenase, Fe-S oxidoreductase subunit YkgE [Fluviibacter phosphoraccumulans EoVTN8]
MCIFSVPVWSISLCQKLAWMRWLCLNARGFVFTSLKIKLAVANRPIPVASPMRRAQWRGSSWICFLSLGPSGSCAGMMRHHYPTLFAGTSDAAKAAAIADRVWELSEFLVRSLNFNRPDCGKACSVALHTSCSARRETGALAATRSLLQGLEGVTLKIQEHESECCGFGGMFSVRHPEISGGIVRDKVASMVNTLPPSCWNVQVTRLLPKGRHHEPTQPTGAYS